MHPALPINAQLLVSDPFRLVALFLNASNGDLIKKLDWPLPANPQAVAPSFFFPLTNGRFVVGLGSTLDLYSSDFKLLHHFDAQSELSPIVSPSGKSLLLPTVSQVDGQWTTRYDLLDTGTLSVFKTWSEAATRPPHTIAALWGDELHGPCDPHFIWRLPRQRQRNFSPIRARCAAAGALSMNRNLLV